MKNIVNLSLIVFLAFVLINMPLQQAYAATPTITAQTGSAAGNSVATTSIVVTFSVGVNGSDAGASGDTAAAWSVAGNTVSSVTSLLFNDADCSSGTGGDLTLTITVGTPLATDAVPQVTYDGDQSGAQNITIRACDGGEALVNASSSIITPTDGLSPTMDSATTTSSTTIDAVFSEDIASGSVSASDFTITNPTSTVSGVSVAGNTVTLTISGIGHNDTPTITLGGDGVDDTSSNTLLSVSLVASDGHNKSGSMVCKGDCDPPTLGVDKNGVRLVENGFTYNGKPIDVESYFTPYPLITVQVGVQNKAVFKIYEGGGPDDVRHFELAFGLANGARIDTTNAAIVWDRNFAGIETVTLIDPENTLENVRVETSEGKCRESSTKNDCLIVTVYHTFRAPLDFNMVGSYVWDERRHGWQNYYNEGIAVEGESLNPPKQYQGTHKGHLITITETGKNKATDEQGNTWTFDGTWIKDFIYKGKIDDPISSQGYDRNHVRFSTYKQGQELVAISLFEKYYKTSFSQEPAFSEIDDIKFYEFPDRIDKKFDPVLQAKMHEEDIRAQKYLEEMFAKFYPGIVYD